MIFIFILMTLSSQSQAYVFDECWATNAKMKWEGASTREFKVASDSMSYAVEQYTENIFQSWEKVDESKLNINYVLTPDNDGLIKGHDSRSEVAFISDEDFYNLYEEDFAGVTDTRPVYNLDTKECLLAEADIIMPESSGSSEDKFKAVFSHELGHAVGFMHTADYGLMLPIAGYKHAGDYNFKPLPDETQGLGDEYGSGSSHTDLGTSRYIVTKYESSEPDTDESYVLYDYYFENEFWICPGASIEPLVTNLNYGTAEKSAKNHFFLSTDKNVATPTVSKSLATYNTKISAHADYARTLNMRVTATGLSYGQTYYLYGAIDSDGAITEKDESNNIYMLGRVNVRSRSSCPGGQAETHSIKEDMMNLKMGETKWQQMANTVHRSLYIIVATVKDLKVSKVNNFLQTTYTLEVNESLRGAIQGQILTIVQKGGFEETVNKQGQKIINIETYANAVHPEVGSKYLFFLGGAKNIPFVGGLERAYSVIKQNGKTYLMTLTAQKHMTIGADGNLAFKDLVNTACADCSDKDSDGQSKVVKVFTHNPGKAIEKESFFAKLKEVIGQAPYMANPTALSTGIFVEPVSIKKVD